MLPPAPPTSSTRIRPSWRRSLAWLGSVLAGVAGVLLTLVHLANEIADGLYEPRFDAPPTHTVSDPGGSAMDPQFSHSRRDKLLSATKALPASAGAVVAGPIDLGEQGNNGRIAPTNERHKTSNFEANVVAVVEVPELDATALPDNATLTVKFEHAQSSDFSDAVEFGEQVLMTGADSAGSEAKHAKYRLPLDCGRYLRCTLTSASTPGDMSAVEATFAVGY